jgi:hypothetical protein
MMVEFVITITLLIITFQGQVSKSGMRLIDMAT